MWMMGLQENVLFVVLKEEKNVGAKEGRFVTLVMGRWNYCLLAAVFPTEFSKFDGKVIILK